MPRRCQQVGAWHCPFIGKRIEVQTPVPPAIRGRDAAGDALGRLLIHAAQRILGTLSWLALDQQEVLHELRKEVRALRSLLRFSKGADPEDHPRGVRNGLAVWFHEQSLQRDFDALAEHWQKLAPRYGLPTIRLHEALSVPRIVLSRDPRVDSRARLAAELLALWSQLLRNPLFTEDILRAYVEERLSRIDEHLIFIDPEQIAEFHRLRIALKNLRDTLRYLSELWPSKDSKSFSKQLHALLDAAGVIRDAQVARHHLPQLLQGENGNELPFSAGILLGYLDARRERESKRFRKHWERFRQAPHPWN